jgi:hypothetical protein
MSTVPPKRSIRTEESYHRQRVAKKIVERVLNSCGFEIIGAPRTVQNRHLIDVRDPDGLPRVLWFKLGWNPGSYGTSGVQIAMLKSGASGQRPASFSDAEVLKRIGRKLQRGRNDGISDLLLFSLDNRNSAPIACLLIPIEQVEHAFREELRINRSLARNGASPTLWIKGRSQATLQLQRAVERFAVQNLLKPDLTIRAEREPIDDAINDFTPDSSVIGSSMPKRRSGKTTWFPRNQRVRERVIARANGRCEYCNHEGFLTPEGKRYLESHHIQFLGEEGPDTENNVIALCANDHRQAHFSAERETLASRMKKIIANRLRQRRRAPRNSGARSRRCS